MKRNEPGAVPRPVMSPPAGTTAEAGEGYPPCLTAPAPLEATTVRFTGGVTVRFVGLPSTLTFIVTSTVGKLVCEPIKV